jgi:hypothetical protein
MKISIHPTQVPAAFAPNAIDETATQRYQRLLRLEQYGTPVNQSVLKKAEQAFKDEIQEHRLNSVDAS